MENLASEEPASSQPAPEGAKLSPLVPRPPPEDGRGDFERRLTREIMISERLRVQLLAAIPGALLILFLAITSTHPEVMEGSLGSRIDRLRVGLLLGGFAAYELFALRGVERLIASGQEPPVLRRYVNALIETSLPTLVVGYYVTVVSPVDALLLPPVFVYFVFILLSTLRLDLMLCVFCGVVAAVEYTLLALVIVRTADAGADPVLTSVPHHLGKALILLVSGIAAGFVARRLRKGFEKTLESMEERNRVVSVFGQHVSPAVVDQLLAQRAGARSEVREVCVMFLDIRNFTRFCENKSPEEVVGYLNDVFAFMIESVNRHQGIVNKFLGDGFMAVFGAPLEDPGYCAHAVAAALEIAAELERRVASGELPPTRIGVGLHAGPAVIGNVGSAMRKEYTVIGDVVNVASRLEALNKELGTRVLATKQVWEASGMTVTAIAKEPLSVRGRTAPIEVLELA